MTFSITFQLFHDPVLSCHWKILKTLLFRLFFDLTKFNTHIICCSPKCMLFVLLTLSCIVLAWTSTVMNLPNLTLIFQDFPGLTIIRIQDLQDLENEILKFYDFPSFSGPLRPCKGQKYSLVTCSTIIVARSRNISFSSDIDCTIDCISFSLCSIKVEFSSTSLI